MTDEQGSVLRTASILIRMQIRPEPRAAVEAVRSPAHVTGKGQIGSNFLSFALFWLGESSENKLLRSKVAKGCIELPFQTPVLTARKLCFEWERLHYYPVF